MSLELWTGKVLVCCKQSLMGHCDGSLEDQNTKRNADRGGRDRDVSEENMNSRRNWTRSIPLISWQRIWPHTTWIQSISGRLNLKVCQYTWWRNFQARIAFWLSWLLLTALIQRYGESKKWSRSWLPRHHTMWS